MTVTDSGVVGSRPPADTKPPTTARTAVVARLATAAAIAAGLLTFALISPAGARTLTHRGSAPPAAGRAAPALRLGSRGPAVRSLQATLARLSYLPRAGIDGIFDMQTWHAVVAFQGWNYLTRDGVVGARTRGALARAHKPTPWSRTTGFEIHITQQVLLIVGGGRLIRAIHVSTGAHASTPSGHFRIYRRDPMSWSVPFGVWMPLAQYFYGGYAIHQFDSVPAYAASHGCVRIPQAEARFVWEFGRTGMRVWTRA